MFFYRFMALLLWKRVKGPSISRTVIIIRKGIINPTLLTPTNQSKSSSLIDERERGTLLEEIAEWLNRKWHKALLY